MFASLNQVFPYVELWLGGQQGILVASKQPFRLPTDFSAYPMPAQVLAKKLTPFGMEELLKSRLIRADQMRSVIDSLGGANVKIADDNNLRLEYSTPRGNVLDEAFAENIRTIRAMAEDL